MAYSRLLNLGEDIENKLKSWLMMVVTDHLAERSSFDSELTQYQEDYDAMPKGKKTFPFDNACNLVIPIFAIAQETTHAAVYSSLYALDNQILEISPADGAVTDHAYHFGNYLNRYLSKYARMKQDLESATIECEKFGTGVAKAIYERVVRYGIKEVGGVETEFPVVVRDGLCFKSVPISRFMLPFESQEVDDSTWCGETYKLTPYQVEQYENQGVFYKGTMEKLKAALIGQENTTDKFEIEQEILDKHQTLMPKRLEIMEIWTCFNTDSADEDDDTYSNKKEVQIFWNMTSNVVCGVRYNTHSDLRKPYEKGVWIKVEHRGYGIGIGKQVDQFQREITIQHRQRIDNATIANIRMFKINKMSGYGPNEPLMAGKFWFLDDMKDLEAFQMGEIYPSSFNNEQQSTLWMQQRVGTNELNQGLPQVGTPGTATSDLARLQESKRKFDYALQNVKKMHLNLAIAGIDIMQQHQIIKYATPTEQQYVQQIMSMPYEMIKNGSVINILMAGSQSNKIMDAQKWDMIAPKLQTFYSGMMQLAMMTKDPNIIQAVMKKALTGGNEAMKQILEGGDVRNMDTFLLNDVIAQLGGSSNALGGLAQNAIGSGSTGTSEVQGNPSL